MSVNIRKYKLTYFNFRARAELARLLFACAGVEFDDERITTIEKWVELKPATPFGQLPLLNVGGVQICQSHAIARYLAREFGFAGKTNLDQARADMVVECVADMLDPIQPCYREPDNVKKEQMRRSYREMLPDFMEKLEKMLENNNNGNEYFVGSELTWADLAVMNAWHWIPGFGVFPPLNEFPKLEAHRLRVESQPCVMKWLETRPETPV
ncbi:hypothetical protein LSH36_201g04023 [Paralvinella palmiformis]|uniref:Glutathione S-transferase n=1 Tax=Paralvinella palmiformis TaxID=53620 RepID=A0AAD9JRS4_9ANNE|nr:hypothetical protein LSH36_201g04023 [Paralvinella palmiformis]